MDLHLHDALHLTCVRGGGCCHAQRIPVTPWEIALLARGMALPSERFRDLHTVDGATRLRAEGPSDARGHAGCSLLTTDGCSQHTARPLACRLFPLGRRLDDGRAIFHLTGSPHPCAALCPTYAAQPAVRIDAWLAGQGVGLGEAAHDAYGRLVGGLLTQAGALAEGDPAFNQGLRQSAALDPATRAARLPPDWYSLVSAPDLARFIDTPERFVEAHGQLLLNALTGDVSVRVLTLASVALQLAVPLGVPSASAVRLAMRE